MLKFYEKIVTVLCRYLAYISISFLFFMMLLTCADVIGRYFKYPIKGTLELSQISMVVVIFFAVAYTGLKKGHISITLFVEHLSKRIQNRLRIYYSIVGAVIWGIIAWRSGVHAWDTRWEIVSLTAIPSFPFKLSISIGASVFCLFLLLQFAKSVSKFSED